MKITNVHMKKIYTKKGDRGVTCLGSNCESISKNSALICALGDIDELNSFVGMAVNFAEKKSEFVEILKSVQKDLYWIGAKISGLDTTSHIDSATVEKIEEFIDKYSKDFSEFVDPGAKGKFSASVHVCRSVCRRAERSVCGIRDNNLCFVLQYLNRLSDLLFVIAEW